MVLFYDVSGYHRFRVQDLARNNTVQRDGYSDTDKEKRKMYF